MSLVVCSNAELNFHEKHVISCIDFMSFELSTFAHELNHSF